MRGFNPAARAAKGAPQGAGPVQGPGSGTSDSVKDAVPPGTYIMPADSTQQIGEPALAGLGFRPGMREAAKAAAPASGLGFKGKGKAGEVPVNLSNGEYKLPPEQVHAVGAQVLDAMKGATHVPVEPRGFRPGGADAPQQATDELYFADGGLVEDPEKKRQAGMYAQANADLDAVFKRGPTTPPPVQMPAPAGFGPAARTQTPTAAPQRQAAPAPAVAPMATGNAPSPTNTFPGNRAEATRGMYAQANDELARGFRGALQGMDATATYLNRGDPVKDAVQAVGGFFARSAEQARQPSTWDDSGTRLQFADPKPQPAQPAPATPAAAQPAPAKPAASGAPAQPGTPAAKTSTSPAPATSAPAAPGGFPGKATGVAGVTRIDEPGKAPMFTNVGADGAGSTAAAPGLGFSQGLGGPDVLGILQRENQIRAGMGPLADQIAFNNGTGGMFRNTTNDEIVRRMLTSDSGKERRTALDFMAGRQDAANRTAQSQQELDMREMDAMSRRDVAAGDLELKREAQGFQTAAARRLQDLQDKFMAEKDPAKRAELAQTIRDLNGKQDPRFTVVPGGQEFDAAAGVMRNVPSRVLNNQTGQFVEPAAGSALRPAPAAGAVMNGYRFKGGNPSDRNSWEKV